MTTGEKIKKLRMNKSITQDELAEKLFVSRNAVSKWENDKGYPSIDSLKLLCKYFEITIDDFLNDEFEVKDISDSAIQLIELDKKNDQKFQLIYFILSVVLYLGTQVLIPAVYFVDLGWILVGPVLVMLVAVFASFKIKRYTTVLLSGVASTLLGMLMILLGLEVYYVMSFLTFILIVYIVTATIVCCIKQGRLVFFPYKVNVKMAIFFEKKLKITPKKTLIAWLSIFGVTLVCFLVILIDSMICTYITHADRPAIFHMFAYIPFTIILIYATPLVVEFVMVILKYKKYKQSKKQENACFSDNVE